MVSTLVTRAHKLVVVLGTVSAVVAPAGASLLTATAARAALPGEFVGMTSEDAFWGAPDYRARTFRAQHDAGVRMLRASFRWELAEPAPGRYDFSIYDQYVASAASQRLRILPILEAVPAFRSSAPETGARAGQYPPRRPDDLGAFAAVLVRRYGPAGSFWAERPDLPTVPIRSWQVWNEPNAHAFWASGPDPLAYAALLKATSASIKAADPHAEVVAAGITNSLRGVPFAEFIAGMYRAGAADAFDTLAIHGYAPDDDATVALAERARELMDARGDRKKMRMTEFGWASGGPASRFTVDDQGQTQRLRCAMTKLAEGRERLGIRGIAYYNWRDLHGPVDYWGLHTGLLDRGGRPKLASATFGETALALEADTPGANEAPTACTTGSPAATPLEPVKFASTSLDRDGSVVRHAWDLDGDGLFDDAAGRTATRRFATAAAHTVRLKVTDDAGAIGVASHTVRVG